VHHGHTQGKMKSLQKPSVVKCQTDGENVHKQNVAESPKGFFQLLETEQFSSHKNNQL